MEQQLSPHRLWLLFRSNLLAGYRAPVYISGVAAGILFLISLWEYLAGIDNPSFHRDFFGYGLFIWGLWATSRAFRPLQDRARREAYLLLPASSIEKTLASLIPVTAGFVLFYLVFITALSLVIEGFNLVVFGSARPIFNPFDPVLWELIAAYIILQSPYFLGAAWFRRAPFLLTSLTLILLLVGFTVVALVAVRIAFGGAGWGMWNAFEALGDWHYAGGDVIEVVLLVLIPPVLWFIAWLRVREAQVDHGV